MPERPSIDRCCAARCKDPPTINYVHNNVLVACCSEHWRRHCDPLHPFDLKKICDKYKE